MSEKFKFNMQVENLSEKEMSKLYKRIDLLIEELFKGDKYCDISITDSIGGIHSEGLGWNPQGIYCGECNKITCFGCKVNEKENVKCVDCEYLGIKDLCYGYCKHSKGLTGIIQPNDSCKYGVKGH